MPQPEEPGDGNPPVESHESGQPDFYLENGLLVFTAAHHLNRGSCCGSGCRHCPYDPPHVEGNRKVR
jgi:hypothetical protein